MDAGDPIVSIDTKKKEKVGEFKNNGKEWCLKGLLREALDHDFMIKELGQVAPYGVYVLNDNTGFINLGVDHDTSEFAVESIWRWWNTLGKNSFPEAKRIYINCDGGGSNGATRRAWKVELQRFADKTGLTVTRTGLAVKCQLDINKYELGSIITDGMLERIKITPRVAREGEEAECAKQLAIWNYTIQPRNGEEQAAAAKLDAEEILAEKTRVKRTYNKKKKDSN